MPTLPFIAVIRQKGHAISTDFDPYYRWLGIPARDQPPNHYRLLGVELFEPDLEVIAGAADKQMAHLRSFQTGPHGKLSQQLCNEVSAARICLLNLAKRGPYDAELRTAMASKEKPPVNANVVKAIALDEPIELAEAKLVEPMVAGSHGFDVDSLIRTKPARAPGAIRPAPKLESPYHADRKKVQSDTPALPSRLWIFAKHLTSQTIARLPAIKWREWSAVQWAAIGVSGIGMIALATIVLGIRTQNGTVTIEVTNAPKDFKVLIDGNSIEIQGLKDPLSIKIGEHDLEVNAANFQTFTRKFSVSSGSESKVTVMLEPIPLPTSKASDTASKEAKPLANPSPPPTVAPIAEEPKKATAPIDPVTPEPKIALAPFDSAKAKEYQEAWAKHLGVPLVETNSIGMKLTLIPPGEFMMGSPKEFIDEESQPNAGRDGWYVSMLPAEVPQHRVRITRPFWLGTTVVTQDEYQRVMGQNPSRFKGEGTLPVEQNTWFEATEFCRRLSELPDEKSSKRQYQLPTEAQWEHACRAGNPAPSFFQPQNEALFSKEHSKLLGDYAWFGSNSAGRTHPVMQKRANVWGLFDLYGNVWQMCRDRFDLSHRSYYSDSPSIDPTGPLECTHHPNRGGAYEAPDYYCRSAFRHIDVPEARGSHVGFRVCAVIGSQTVGQGEGSNAREKVNQGSDAESVPRAGLHKGTPKRKPKARPVPDDHSDVDAQSDAKLIEECIDSAKNSLKPYKMDTGHVIYGKVVVDAGDDPSEVLFQSPILKNGIFATATRDLVRPVGFRMHQYAPYDLELRGREGVTVDVGEIRMRRLLPNELLPLKGKLALEGGEDPSRVAVSLSLYPNPINSPGNGFSPRSSWWRLSVNSDHSGSIDLKGFSPIQYYCSISQSGFVPKMFPIDFKPPIGADIGTLKLEKTRQANLEFIVSKDGPFDIKDVKKAVVCGGDHWKSTPEEINWDIEFKQNDGKLSFACCNPYSMADLGKANLSDYLNVNLALATKQPTTVPMKNGHVYLLKTNFVKSITSRHNILFHVSFDSPDDQARQDAPDEALTTIGKIVAGVINLGRLAAIVKDKTPVTVVFLQDSRSKLLAWNEIGAVRNQFCQQINAAGGVANESPQLNEIGLSVRPSGLLKPADLAKFTNNQADGNFLFGVYYNRGKTRLLSLALKEKQSTRLLPINPPMTFHDGTVAISALTPALNLQVLKCAGQQPPDASDTLGRTFVQTSLQAAGAQAPLGYFGRALDKCDPIFPGDILEIRSGVLVNSNRVLPYRVSVIKSVESLDKVVTWDGVIDSNQYKRGLYVYRPEKAK